MQTVKAIFGAACALFAFGQAARLLMMLSGKNAPGAGGPLDSVAATVVFMLVLAAAAVFLLKSAFGRPRPPRA